ncbi:MAG: EamA family transporter [Thermoplasmata archaeon]|nr:EamA family transporter [Thermoplasmata archaeon]
MGRTTPDGRTLGGFAVLVLAWGLNYLFVRVGLQDSPPLWLALLRAGLGAAGVFVALALTRRLGSLTRRDRRDAVLIGVPTFGCFFGLWFAAAVTILPGEAAVFVYTFPLWVTLLSIPVLGQRVTVGHVGAVMVGFFAVVLISSPWNGAGQGLPWVPVAELLGGALSWATGTVLAQRRFAPAEMMEANAYQLLGGTVVLLTAVVLFEPRTLPHASVSLLGAVLWLGLVGTALGYAIWFELLSRIRAPVLSAYVFLVPVVALSASVALLGERLTFIQIAGVLLLLASLYGIGRISARAGTRATPLRDARAAD